MFDSITPRARSNGSHDGLGYGLRRCHARSRHVPHGVSCALIRPCLRLIEVTG